MLRVLGKNSFRSLIKWTLTFQFFKMMHPYVIDTSVIFCITGERRRKSKLSVLSSMFLGEKIQHDRKGSHLGHDPKEDAEAAM